MKPFGDLKSWMPLVGLGAALVLAPQSRAQADVAPDHFDENGVVDVIPAKAPAARAKATPANSTQAANKKSGTHAGPQATAAKNGAQPQKPEVVAVNDKRKVPAPAKPSNSSKH